MEPFFNAQCTNLLEESLSSDLGQGIVQFFANDKNSEIIFPISEIRTKLKENKYKNVDEFISSVEETFKSAAKSLGYDSEVSLALLTVLKLIVDDAKKMSAFNRENFYNKIEEFSAELKNILQKFPDNIEEYQLLVDKFERLSIAEPVMEKTSEKSFEKTDVDVLSLYAKLNTLPSDQNVSSVIDLISRYEAIVPENQDVLDVDMTRFQPYTLRILQEYVDNLNSSETKPETHEAARGTVKVNIENKHE